MSTKNSINKKTVNKIQDESLLNQVCNLICFHLITQLPCIGIPAKSAYKGNQVSIFSLSLDVDIFYVSFDSGEWTF